jgi:hypothetical protein
MEDNIRNDAGSTAANARNKVRAKAAEVAGKAKQKIADQYGEKVSEATNEVQHFASALRRAGQNLRDDGSSTIGASLLTRAADQLESIGSSLNGKDLDAIISDVDRLARRNPAVFAGGAMLIGFAASRFLKSSSRNVHRNFDFQAADLPDYGSELRSTSPRTDFETTPGTDFGISSPGTGFGSSSGGTGAGGGNLGGL